MYTPSKEDEERGAETDGGDDADTEGLASLQRIK